jgi:hypothetical protein
MIKVNDDKVYYEVEKRGRFWGIADENSSFQPCAEGFRERWNIPDGAKKGRIYYATGDLYGQSFKKDIPLLARRRAGSFNDYVEIVYPRGNSLGWTNISDKSFVEWFKSRWPMASQYGDSVVLACWLEVEA